MNPTPHKILFVLCYFVEKKTFQKIIFLKNVIKLFESSTNKNSTILFVTKIKRVLMTENKSEALLLKTNFILV